MQIANSYFPKFADSLNFKLVEGWGHCYNIALLRELKIVEEDS